MKRAGTLAVSNTTINYTKKLPAANAEVCKAVGASLKADGGALFVKLLNQTTGKYLGDNEKVKVTLTGVTTAYTGDKTTDPDGEKGQTQPYGIYTDKDRTVEKHLEVTGDVSVTDNSFVRFNTTQS